MVTSSKGIDPLEIDQRITRLAFEAPGIAQADVIRGLIQQWTPSYVRQRIEILDARGTLRTERRGSRVHVYPVRTEAIEA